MQHCYYNCENSEIWFRHLSAFLGLLYVRFSPDTSSFLAFVRAGFRKSAVRPGFFGPICKYIRTLPIAKAYDGMKRRKLVSFQYKKGKEFSLYSTISSTCHAETFTHTLTCAVNRNCWKQFVFRTSILGLSLLLSQVQAQLCLGVKMKQATDRCSVLMCLQYCYVTTSNIVVNYQDIFRVKFCAQCEYSKTC